MHLSVKELIEILTNKDPDNPVYISGGHCLYAATSVEDRNGKEGTIIESDEI